MSNANLFLRMKVWREHQRKKRIEKEYRRITVDANEKFQIKELNKELWLTFMSIPICPFNLFKDDPISSLYEVRKSYIDRNKR